MPRPDAYDSSPSGPPETAFSRLGLARSHGHFPIEGAKQHIAPPTSTSSFRLAIQYAYQNGLLQQVKDFNSTTVYWSANAANARGEVTQETLGNGVITNRSFDAVTGWLSSIQAGVGGGAGLQNQSYLYDLVGNVTQRQNNALGLTESFCYDNVYRLDHSTLTGVCTGTTNLQMTYDATGNITARSDIAAGAAWTYSTTHKHQALQAGDASHTYTYDANGNAITRNSQTIGWTSYNLPNLINATGESSTFTYGPRHEKWTQVYTGPSGTETTTYYGKLLETVVTSAGTDWRHYIFAGSEQVAIYSRTSGGTNTLRYSLEDHLGSPSAITSSTGTLLVNENFAAYGAQRNSTTWSGAPPPGDLTTIAGITRQGYTGQTMLGNMGLIHYNGRVMDAITGRFLSADPYISEPGNTQNFNRYGYVYNNPLSYIDPSGFKKKHATNSTTGSGSGGSGSSGTGGGTGGGAGPMEEIVISGTRGASQDDTTKGSQSFQIDLPGLLRETTTLLGRGEHASYEGGGDGDNVSNDTVPVPSEQNPDPVAKADPRTEEQYIADNCTSSCSDKYREVLRDEHHRDQIGATIQAAKNNGDAISLSLASDQLDKLIEKYTTDLLDLQQDMSR